MLKEIEILDLIITCCPILDLPEEVAHMSIDTNLNINYNEKRLPKLNENAVANNITNLNILSEFKPELILPHIDKDYILYLLSNLKKKQIYFPMKFISYRGTLSKICGLPYENKENLIIAAIKLEGKIFLWRYCSKGPNKSLSLNSLKGVFSGHRFEQLITIPHDDKNVGPLNQEPFFSAVRTKLTCNLLSHDLFYAGEVDCIRQSNNKYIEIKTRIIRKDNYALRRYCYLKWWLQSYLMGIDTVIVGFRNNNFIVEDIVEYDKEDFYKSALDLWNSNDCFGFLGIFLTEVENLMADFNDSDICIINFEVESKKLTFKKTTQAESPQYDFLPLWFRSEWSD